MTETRRWDSLLASIGTVDLTQVTEDADMTARGEQTACGGGGCDY